MKAVLKQNLKDIIYALVILVLGILFCVYKSSFIDTIETIFIVVFLGFGLIFIFGFLCADYEVRNISLLLVSVIFLILGILVIFIPSFFTYSLGLMLIIFGVKYIMDGYKQKKQSGDWKIMIGLGVVVLALGLAIVITNLAGVSQNLNMLIIGISLIVQSVLDLVYLGYIVYQSA